MSVIDEIEAERRRQVEVEGWTSEHDDEHVGEELALAAAALALANRPIGFDLWPWKDQMNWNKGPRRNLVRAGALIVAEIERLDRQ